MDTINRIAANHIEKLNQETEHEVDLSFRYGLGNLIEFPSCFYFDYLILKKQGSNEDPPTMGGAPGFKIDKGTNRLEVISHYRLVELKKEKQHRLEILSQLNRVKSGKEPLLALKKMLHLNSPELLKLKNELQKEKISEDYLNQLMQKMINE